MEWESSLLDLVYDHSYYCKSEDFVCGLSWDDGLAYFRSHAIQHCQAPNSSFDHALLYQVDAQGDEQCILNGWLIKPSHQNVDELFVKKYLIVGDKTARGLKMNLFNENLKRITISNPKLLDEILQVSHIDEILSLVTTHLIKNSSYKITAEGIKALENFTNKLFDKYRCDKQRCDVVLKLLARHIVDFYHSGEDLFLLNFASQLDKDLQDGIIHVLIAKKPTYDLQNAISNNITKYTSNYIAVSVFTHYINHYDQTNVAQFIAFLKGSDEHAREIAFEKIHKDIKHISATKLDSFTKLLVLDNQRNFLAKAYSDAYEYSRYILDVEYLKNIEGLFDDINYKTGAAKLFVASLEKAILNHSGDFKKIETYLDKLFDKSNIQNLPKSLIKAIFEFYHKDQSYFTKQVVTLLAEVKGIEIELLSKIKDVLFRIGDKQSAIFIAKRLNEYHITFDQKEVRDFFEFLKDTSAIKLSTMNFLCSVFGKYDKDFRIEILTKLIEFVDNAVEYNKISKIVQSLNDKSLKQLLKFKLMLISNKHTENLETILALAKDRNNFSLIQSFLKRLLHSQSKSNIGVFNEVRDVLEKNLQWDKIEWSNEENKLLSLINSSSHNLTFGKNTFILDDQQKTGLEKQLTSCGASLVQLTFDSYEDILDLISFVNTNKIEKDVLEAALLESKNDTELYIKLLVSLLEKITNEDVEFDTQYLALLYSGNFQLKTLYTILKTKNLVLLDRIIEYNLSEIDTGRDGKSVGQIILTKDGLVDSINRVIRDNRFFVPKNDEAILREMLEYNSDNGEILNLLNGGYYKTQLNKIEVLKNSGTVNGKRLSEWNKMDFQEYSKNSTINNDTIAEFLYVVSEAAHRTVLKHIAYPREVQLISALSLYKSEGGGLAQIETGEGKSLIITIFNILKSLEHHNYRRRIDVVTTAPVLAIRDTENLKELYGYFGITVACNIRGRCVDTKEAYKADIVYGTPIHFIGDELRDISTDTRSGRGFDLLVIDEVDSLLIDQINMKVQLSSAVPGMEMMNQVLMYMFWNGIGTATNIKQHGSNGCYFHPPQLSDEQIEIITKLQNETVSEKLNNNTKPIRISDDCNILLSDRIKEYAKENLLESKILTIPKHLESFALGAIQRWVHSLLTSVVYKEDVEYMLVNSQKDTGYNFTITCPIDAENTGSILYRLHLSDGLQQFLSLKHRLPLTAETFTTTFMSYYGYLSKYKGSIYGVTGTLGDQLDREYLKNVYGVKLINIPRFIGRDFRILNAVMANEDTWIEKIVNSATKNAKTRSVLIILDTLNKVETVYTALKSDTKLQVKMYGRDRKYEQKIVEEELQVGDVIVASNLAGRGTDLKLSPEVIKNGGLHVIVGTFPKHIRVEDQAYGRTARKEEPGSGQMILNLDHINSTCTDIACLYKERAESESYILKDMQKCVIPNLELKDKAFDAINRLIQIVNSPTNYLISTDYLSNKQFYIYLYQEDGKIFIKAIKDENNAKVFDEEVIFAIDPQVLKHIKETFAKGQNIESNLSKQDLELIHYLAAQGGFTSHDIIIKRINYKFNEDRKSAAKGCNKTKEEYLRCISKNLVYKDLLPQDPKLLDKVELRAKFNYWLEDRKIYNRDYEVQQLLEYFGIWLKVNDNIFSSCPDSSSENMLNNALQKFYEEFRVKIASGRLFENPAFLVKKAWHLTSTEVREKNIRKALLTNYRDNSTNKISLWSYFKDLAYESYHSVKDYGMWALGIAQELNLDNKTYIQPNPLGDAIECLNNATSLDPNYSWTAYNALSYAKLLRDVQYLTELNKEEVEKMNNVKIAFSEDTQAAIDSIRNTIIPNYESQVAFLLTKGVVKPDDQIVTHIYGSIAIYERIIELLGNNIKFVSKTTYKEGVRIDHYIDSNEFIPHNVSDIIASKINNNFVLDKDNVMKQVAQNITFGSSRYIIDDITHSGGFLFTLESYELQKDWSGTFFAVLVGAFSIAYGLSFITMGTTFTTLFGYSLVLGGVGDLVQSATSVITGNPIDFNDFIKSKCMSIGVAIATAGTLVILSKIDVINRLLQIDDGIKKITEAAQDIQKFITTTASIQATISATGYLLYEASKNIIDDDSIKRSVEGKVREFVKKHKENLQLMYASDAFAMHIGDQQMRNYFSHSLDKIVNDAIENYSKKFHSDEQVTPKEYLFEVIEGIGLETASFNFVKQLMRPATTVISGMIKNLEAMDEIISDIDQKITQLSTQIISPTDMLLKSIKRITQNDVTQLELEVLKQKIVDCDKSLNLINTKYENDIRAECKYIRNISNTNYSFESFQNMLISSIVGLKASIQKEEIIKPLTNAAGAAIVNDFKEKHDRNLSEREINSWEGEERAKDKVGYIEEDSASPQKHNTNNNRELKNIEYKGRKVKEGESLWKIWNKECKQNGISWEQFLKDNKHIKSTHGSYDKLHIGDDVYVPAGKSALTSAPIGKDTKVKIGGDLKIQKIIKDERANDNANDKSNTNGRSELRENGGVKTIAQDGKLIVLGTSNPAEDPAGFVKDIPNLFHIASNNLDGIINERYEILHNHLKDEFTKNNNKPLIVEGHSAGGLEVLILLKKNPEMIKNIILIDPPRLMHFATKLYGDEAKARALLNSDKVTIISAKPNFINAGSYFPDTKVITVNVDNHAKDAIMKAYNEKNRYNSFGYCYLPGVLCTYEDKHIIITEYNYVRHTADYITESLKIPNSEVREVDIKELQDRNLQYSGFFPQNEYNKQIFNVTTS